MANGDVAGFGSLCLATAAYDFFGSPDGYLPDPLTGSCCTPDGLTVRAVSPDLENEDGVAVADELLLGDCLPVGDCLPGEDVVLVDVDDDAALFEVGP